VFEQVVRPAQKPQVVTTRRIVSVREVVEVEPAGVKWGKPGTLPTAIEVPPEEDPGGISFTVKKDKEHELDYAKSTTQKIKITNPDDPDQFVVAERIKKAVFKDKKPDNVAVYRVNPDGTEAASDRDTTYDNNGGSVETVNPNRTSSTASPFQPLQVQNNNYSISWPKTDNEEIVSEKGPST
jgi:hypothetical protein